MQARILVVPRILVALSVAVLLLSDQPRPAHGIAADLANKCRELMVKAYPSAPAGSKHGTAQVERQYYQTCLTNGGHMGDQQGDHPSGDGGAK
jgi:hypothetical protein